MYMLNSEKYNQEKIHESLDMMFVDRKNQFRELSHVLLPKMLQIQCSHGKNLS